MKRPNRSTRGTALLETTIGAALLATLAGSAFLAAKTVQGTYATEFTSSGLNDMTIGATQAVTERLRGTDLDTVFPAPTVGSFSDWIDFEQSALPGAANPMPPETLRFEYDPADPNDGVDNDRDGLVDEGRLVWIENKDAAGEVRRVLTNNVAENLEGEILGNLVDDNENGLIDEMGVCFEFQSRRIVFHLTLQERDPNGVIITKSVQRTIAPRNTSELEAKQ